MIFSVILHEHLGTLIIVPETTVDQLAIVMCCVFYLKTILYIHVRNFCFLYVICAPVLTEL